MGSVGYSTHGEEISGVSRVKVGSRPYILEFGLVGGEGAVVVNSENLDLVFTGICHFLRSFGAPEEIVTRTATDVLNGISDLRTVGGITSSQAASPIGEASV